ncbi:PKD domain-containing protein, partial [Maribacter sp. 4U21]|uniref:PKD domain-containing protein n=2 Tax=Maribacter sp. 4U21 TaxID=1889779 RepID=UPI00117D5989
EFHYVYQELEGDGEIVARVVSLGQTNPWAKAGVMIRGDLDANAAMAMMILAPNPNNLGGPGYSFQSRPSKGGSLGTGNYTLPALVPGGFPHYVRLVRSGNTFTGYVSETNGNWSEVGSQSVAMGQSVFVGLATTSHSDGQLTTAVYDNVSLVSGNNDQPPVAVADSDVTEGLAPLAVGFDGSGSIDDIGIATYTWDFGDGATGTGETVSHTYTVAGIYTATLTVTDGGGATDTDTLTITVEGDDVACGPPPSPWTGRCYDTGRLGCQRRHGHDDFGA